MESGSLQWDTFEGTIAELRFARLWLDGLKLVPDELHMAQKLIETIRDLMSKLAVWNNSRQQGAWYYCAEWALAANRKVFARNWRTYHLREALAVSASSGKFDSMLPAVVVVLGRSITQLLHYLRHDPDVGPPVTEEVPTGPKAAAYAQVSACCLAAAIWFIATTVLPDDMGRSLHLHALWQLVRVLVRSSPTHAMQASLQCCDVCCEM